MSVERRQVLGEQRTAVSELGPDAAGELTALSDAAYPLVGWPPSQVRHHGSAVGAAVPARPP